MTAALRALVAPRAVVVVGASDDPARIGGRPLQQLREHGFAGRVYGVNPRHTMVQGWPCFPDLASLPEVPDVAVLSVNAEASIGAVEACARLGIPAAVMFSAGFAELHTALGQERQARLSGIAERHGMAIAGPNCTGVANLRTGAVMSFSPFKRATGPGRVALVSQSGALAATICAAGEESALDFGYIVTTGNEACLGLTDYLEHLADDADCTTVLAYVEQVRDGPRFLRAARLLRERGKLLVAMKVGRSAKGVEAAQSHTAALAGNDRAYRAAFWHAGVVEAGDIAEMVDIAALHQLGRRPGAAVGVLSVSGAAGVALADLFADAGHPLPNLPTPTQERLRALIPDYGMVSNPVDMTANVVNDSSVLPSLLSIVAETPGFGTVVLFMSGGLLGRSLPNLAVPGQTLLVNVDGLRNGDPAAIRQSGIAYFTDMGRAVRAIAALARWHARPPQASEQNRQDAASLEVAAALAGFSAAGRTTLSEMEGKQFLAKAGLDCVPDSLVTDAASAGRVSGATCFPVVLKLVSPDVPHKSEVGGVRIGIGSEADAEAAFRDIIKKARERVPNARIEGVTVQPQIQGGVELLLGATRDATFGWLLTVGFGGVWTELLGDVAQALPPVSEAGALQMLRELRAFPLLDGFRGAPRADLEAACRAIARFSRMLLASGDALSELEVNPLLVRSAGHGAVVADALVVLRASGPNPGPVP